MIIQPARVSVIIPTFNRRRVLGRAIQSATGRIGAEDEIIVVDDGSTDGTADFLSETYPTVRVITTENRGPAAARNTGIDVAHGRFIAFLDSDDEWLDNGLSDQVRALEADPGIGLSYAASQNVDGDGKPFHTRPRHACRGDCLRELLRRNFVTTSTAVVPSKVLREVGLFDVELDHSMDWDLWLRIAESRRFSYLDRPVARYRFHEGQQIRHREAVDDCRSRILANRLELYETERPELVPYVRRLLAYRLLRLGRLHLRNGNRPAARECFRGAVRYRPLARLTAARYEVYGLAERLTRSAP